MPNFPELKILILAAHIQPYMHQAIASLLQSGHISVMLVHEPAAPTAPSETPEHQHLTSITYTRNDPANIFERIKAFQPDVTYTAGWMNKRYLLWLMYLKSVGSVTICGMDNQWKNTWKQKALSMSGRWFRKLFDYIWVPGTMQYEYAARLGFPPDRILTDLYTTDTERFNAAYTSFRENCNGRFPKTLLYAGRMVPHKVAGLIEGFCGVEDAARHSWKLLLVGNGPLASNELVRSHPAIEYVPFMHQNELLSVAAEGGVFCLCSYDEPWGMVAQEFACAGMPLIMSRQCGSQPHFLSDGYNGYVCDGLVKESISGAIRKIVSLSDQELLMMGERSHVKGNSCNNRSWLEVLTPLFRQGIHY